MLVESFLKYIRYELNLSAYTVLCYKNDLSQFVTFLTRGNEDFDAASVTPNDIRSWMVDLAGRGIAPRSVKRKIQALRAFFRFLLKKGVVASNPASDVELAKVPKRLPDYIRPANMESLFAEPIDEADFEEVRDRLILLVLYTTGLRRTELIGLRDSDVDMSARELKVHGKRNKDRLVPFGNELYEELAKYVTLRNEEVGTACDAFFVRKNGKPIYPSLVYRLARERLSEIGGGSRYSPHVLRHTFASAMLNDGAALNSVKELLGHESLAATQIYTHITYSELKSNYEHAHPRAFKKGG